MKNDFSISIEELITLRKTIHKYPELSGNEKETAREIVSYAEKYNPQKIITNLDGNGIAVFFDSGLEGPVLLIRCELDALPIQEENNFEHRSTFDNVSHMCGHDGHMAIVSGLIPILSKNKIKKGKVVLLYQPAEETGEGAFLIVNDKKIQQINPDYVFALHNMPGFKRTEIIIKENVFAAASKGMIIKLKGKTSHAAEPEKGINPSLAVSEMIKKLIELPQRKDLFKDFNLITVVHAKIGEKAFGTSPGYAELMCTLRSFDNNDMEALSTKARDISKQVAGSFKLDIEIEWVEEFPATVNDKDCIMIVKRAAEDHELDINMLDEPVRWSEDFGHFTNNYKGALFGLGTGIEHPKLHNPDYDFPDEMIITGIKMFYSIVKKILN